MQEPKIEVEKNWKIVKAATNIEISLAELEAAVKSQFRNCDERKEYLDRINDVRASLLKLEY
jgi:hypothetical protein